MNKDEGVRCVLMKVVSEGLSHFSYFVGNGRTAFVVDPRRDVEAYLDLAKRNEMNITHILETHRNEDYVIGSQELVERTGAKVLHGAGLPWRYGEIAKDGMRVRFGDLLLEALSTPGHTYESMSYVLRDGDTEEPLAVFTGDALFVGEVGRTDLAGPSERERLSELLFASLHDRILPLGDSVILAPAHGGGSVCGGDISERDISTLGVERKTNPRLQMPRKDFVRFKMKERIERPPYFSRMEAMNLGHAPLSGMPEPKGMAPKEFAAAKGKGGFVVDTRFPHSYAGAHIDGALSIWIDGIPVYAGWLVPYDRPLLLVVEDPIQVERLVRMFVRLGFDYVAGYLRGGMVQWYREGLAYTTLPTMDVKQLQKEMSEGDVFVLDPRPYGEWAEVHLKEANHLFVGELASNLDKVPRDKPVASMCSVGFRGSMAAGILRDHGYRNVRIVLGGVSGWEASGFEVEKGD
ncbi:MAG TPA: MBL fold metallo-hydrolase [Methanomassiliicoccales archaeon]|nr:MBL fold metallo-hydrolase [Methanomassiliicoccales archaeon]